jgi:hypothetical protein
MGKLEQLSDAELEERVVRIVARYKKVREEQNRRIAAIVRKKANLSDLTHTELLHLGVYVDEEIDRRVAKGDEQP